MAYGDVTHYAMLRVVAMVTVTRAYYLHTQRRSGNQYFHIQENVVNLGIFDENVFDCRHGFWSSI